jgi:hypothetical protein
VLQIDRGLQAVLVKVRPGAELAILDGTVQKLLLYLLIISLIVPDFRTMRRVLLRVLKVSNVVLA